MGKRLVVKYHSNKKSVNIFKNNPPICLRFCLVIIALLTKNTGFGQGFSYSDWQNSSRDQSNLETYWLACCSKICIVGLSSAKLEMYKTVHLKFYLPLSGRSKHKLQQNISIYWLMKDKFNLHGSAKWTWVHTKIPPQSFVVQDLFFSMKLFGFMSKALKLSLTELVRQCRNISPLTFSALTSLSVGQYGKYGGQYIPAVTSHSVNKI